MRDRNKAREANISREGRRTFSSRTTRGETKKLDEGRRTTRSIQEPLELLTSRPRVHINVSLVDLKNEGGLKIPKPTRQSQRRSSLSTSKLVPVEESKSSPSSVPPRESEASRSGEQDGSLNAKGRTRNVMKNGQTLAAARAVSDKIENISRVTRRSLSVTNLINDGMLNERNSRKRNSDFVSNSPPLKRFNRSVEKRENEEKENVDSVKCGDCGKKTGRLRLSHHVGVPICDTCELVRQTKYGNVQMSHKSCRVLLFDIRKQLGCVNQTSSYIVSGDYVNPLLNQKGTKVSVGKRFKCEIQSGTDGKFRQGGEPTKYRVPKLRIKRIQSVDDINIERHGPVERKIMSRRSSGRLNKDKTAVSTRSGRIRRPTYKIRLNETSSLGSNSQNRQTSRVSNSSAQSTSKHDIPLRRDKRFRSSVVRKKPSVQSISTKKLLQKYSSQKVERKSLRFQINAQSGVSNLKRKATFSAVCGKIGISKTKDKVRTVITKSLKVHRRQKVTKIPYCCKTCQKNFGSTVEGKSHELSHDNRILKIIVDKYSAKSTGKVVTSYDVDTGKCLQNLVWIPADIMKGDMMSSSVPEKDGKSDTASPPVPEEDNNPGSSLTLQSTNVDRNKESAINVTCDGVTESSKDFHADSGTEKDTILEGTALVPSGIYSSETIRNNKIEDPSRLQAECAVTADTLEIKELNGDCKEPSERIDIGKPPEEHTVLIPSERSKEESSHILQTDVSPKPSDHLENEHTSEINDSSEETVIDVGTEETNKIEESCNENQVGILDDQHHKPCIEASLECAPETGITDSSTVTSSITIDKNTCKTSLANQSLLDGKDNESKLEITCEKETGSETLSEEEPGVLKENETLKEGKAIESIIPPCEQESLEKKQPDVQSRDEDKGNDNTHVAGMVVESLMEQIFEGTQQDEEKKSEEASKECSLNTIIETLSEEYNSNQDDRDHEKACNGDNVDARHINSAEGKATDDTTLPHVEKAKEHPVDTYLEPISDDETECFDSFDV